jgi:hypothetical protein
MSEDEGYIVIPNPSNPNLPVRAKLLKYKKTKGEDFEYTLDNGTKVKLIIQVDNISRPIDPSTNLPAVNPSTGEPVLNVSWGIRVKTIYSEKALNEVRR